MTYLSSCDSQSNPEERSGRMKTDTVEVPRVERAAFKCFESSTQGVFKRKAALHAGY